MDRNRRIYEISELIHNLSNASESVEQILEKMMQAVGAEAASLWLLNKSTSEIGLFAARGEKSNRLQEIKLKVGQGICGYCVQNNQTVLVEDVTKDSRWFQGADRVTGFQTRSLISVPLFTESEGTFGCVQLLNKKDNALFNKEDSDFAELIASLFSISLVKNHIYVSETEKREDLLKISDLSKVYGSGAAETVALNHVSLTVKKGELLVILGASGSGKSTLLNIIGGMTKATGGSMVIQGEDICKYSTRRLTSYRKNRIGFVFQFYNLIADLTARENVALTAELVKSKLSVDEMLQLVGMGDKPKKYPSQLSGGEQQRVSIARALVKNTDLLLCDEPTGALDFHTGRQVLILLEELARKHQKTVIIVTHSIPIASIADRVIRMSGGRIEEEILNPSPIHAETVEW